MINLMSKLDSRLLAIEIKVFKLHISILGIYLLLSAHDLKFFWFCFFFTGSITYVVIGAVLVVIALFVLSLCYRRRCKRSSLQRPKTHQMAPETSSDATTYSGNLSNDIIIG